MGHAGWPRVPRRRRGRLGSTRGRRGRATSSVIGSRTMGMLDERACGHVEHRRDHRSSRTFTIALVASARADLGVSWRARADDRTPSGPNAGDHLVPLGLLHVAGWPARLHSRRSRAGGQRVSTRKGIRTSSAHVDARSRCPSSTSASPRDPMTRSASWTSSWVRLCRRRRQDHYRQAQRLEAIAPACPSTGRDFQRAGCETLDHAAALLFGSCRPRRFRMQLEVAESHRARGLSSGGDSFFRADATGKRISEG